MQAVEAGKKKITSVMGHELNIRAEVAKIEGLSGHSDMNSTINYLRNIKGIKKVILNHGEIDAINELQKEIKQQLKLRAEQYLLKEKGVRFEMIRHFRYASIGFYAVKAEHANSNGGFKFIVALPPYKYKRHKYIPRVSTSLGTGITYNAGNEKYYYKMPYSNASDNIMQQNSFNPYFIKSELLNF